MKPIVRKTVDSSMEDKITTAMIVSDRFLKVIYPCFDISYLRTQLAKDVARWAIEYYEHYEKAPGLHIQDIFEQKRDQLERDHVELIEKFLRRLSKEYEKLPHINEDYYVDQALAFFKKREIELISENSKRLAEAGSVEEAEDVLLGYKRIAKATSGWYNPLSDEEIINTFENTNEILFQLPGHLGNFIGPFERGWLIDVVGGFKRGKTWYLQEIGIQALLSELRVAIFSLEMMKGNMNRRIYKRIMSAGDEEETNFIYPIMDCKFSQDGTCVKPFRKSRIQLLQEDGSVPIYSPDLMYKPCSLCRGKEDYSPAIWYEALSRPKFTLHNTRTAVREFVKYIGENLRVRIHPRFSATISDIRRDLDVLEDVEGFIPDVIIIDYAGIIRPEGRSKQEYSQLDDIWKSLGGLAGERHALVATGSQVTRGALSLASISQDSVAGWVGQLAHVDVMFSLNQRPEEKKRGIMRIKVLAHRHKEFYENESCLVLQQLKTGQPSLDSIIIEEEV